MYDDDELALWTGLITLEQKRWLKQRRIDTGESQAMSVRNALHDYIDQADGHGEEVPD